MLRSVLSLLFRAFAFMLVGAAMVVVAQLYGPTLIAQVLPPEMRPAQGDVAEMTPERMMDAIRDLRGALD